MVVSIETKLILLWTMPISIGTKLVSIETMVVSIETVLVSIGTLPVLLWILLLLFSPELIHFCLLALAYFLYFLNDATACLVVSLIAS